MTTDPPFHSSRDSASPWLGASIVVPVAECAELAAVLATVPTEFLMHDRADQIQPARHAVKELVRAFRAQEAIKAEHMILALRDWYHSGVTLHDGHGADQVVWTRLVAMCLDEFYAHD